MLLTVLIFAAAILYSSVGHAGASGYLAAMALVGVAPDVMKPTALALNILVATIATVRFYRAGYFYWAAFWPFVIGSVPLAFEGGAITLPGYVYKPAVGLVLLYSALRLVWSTVKGPDQPADKGIDIPTLPAVASGGVIGLLSGLTGTGGSIFLSPFMLLTGWAGTRPTSGASAAFILANSVAGWRVTSPAYRSFRMPCRYGHWLRARVPSSARSWGPATWPTRASDGHWQRSL